MLFTKKVLGEEKIYCEERREGVGLPVTKMNGHMIVHILL